MITTDQIAYCVPPHGCRLVRWVSGCERWTTSCLRLLASQVHLPMVVHLMPTGNGPRGTRFELATKN